MQGILDVRTDGVSVFTIFTKPYACKKHDK